MLAISFNCVILNSCWCPFLNMYHEEESPMKSKAQRFAKKTKEQERSKERSARESDLQQNTNLPQNTIL